MYLTSLYLYHFYHCSLSALGHLFLALENFFSSYLNVTDEVLNLIYLDKMHNVYTVCFLVWSLNFRHYTPLIYFWITEESCYAVLRRRDKVAYFSYICILQFH